MTSTFILYVIIRDQDREGNPHQEDKSSEHILQRKVREKKRAERVSWWAAVDGKGAAALEQQLCDKMEAVSVQGGGAEEGKRTRSRGGRKKKKR